MMRRGFRRLYAKLHQTDRKRSARHIQLAPGQLMSEIPGWRKCTTIKPLEPDDAEFEQCGSSDTRRAIAA
jgi:hypothetical protein